MKKHRHNKSSAQGGIIYYFLLCLVGLWGSGGCGMDARTASSQADEQVYDIIDKNWQDSFGSRTDYRLNDAAAADPNNTVLTEITQTGKLNLVQAVRLSITASPEYQTAREQLYLTGLEQTEARHLYDMTPFASLTAGQTQAYNSSSRTGRIYDNEIRGGSATAGLSQLLATGAMVTTDLTLGSFDVVSGNYRSGPASIFQAAITQPLLRGADRKVVLETLTQAQRNTLYQIRSFNRYRKTFYVSVVTDYYRLLEYSQRVYNTSENLLALRTLVQKMESLAQVGKIPQFDLERARQNVLQVRDEYARIRRTYEEMLDLFKHRLLIPQNVAIEPDMNDWYELERFGLTEITISEQQSLEAAMAARLDLANMFDQVEDAQRHTEVAQNALGADLTLVGLAAPASHRRFTFSADPGDLQRTQERYELSLRANLPLDRLAERNNYKRTLIALMQAQRAHQQLSNQVEMEVRKAWRDMAEAKDRMSVQKQARELASKRLDDTLLLLQYAKANTPDVLNARRDYFSAQDDYVTALTDLAAAKMNFLRDTETLWINPDGGHEQRVALGQN